MATRGGALQALFRKLTKKKGRDQSRKVERSEATKMSAKGAKRTTKKYKNK